MFILERLKHSVESMVDLSEDRSAARVLVVAGVLVTALCWYVAIAMPELVVIEDESSGRRTRFMALLIMIVTIAGPFIAVQALWTLLSREDPTSEGMESDPTFSFMARVRLPGVFELLRPALSAGNAGSGRPDNASRNERSARDGFTLHRIPPRLGAAAPAPAIKPLARALVR